MPLHGVWHLVKQLFSLQQGCQLAQQLGLAALFDERIPVRLR